MLPFTVTENIVLDAYYEEPISKGVRMDWDAANDQAERLVEQYDVRTPSVDVLVSTLSGGNQQKVIVAREFDRDVTLVIASQPTRGIDVGAKAEIYSILEALAVDGLAILMISSELPEVIGMADRIGVMCEGRLMGILDNADRIVPQEAIMRLAVGETSS